MVDEVDPVAENPDLQASLRKGGIETSTGNAQSPPTYKVFPDSKIPVSKSMGKLWQSRRDQALAKRRQRGEQDRWSEAIQYYNSDHIEGRVEGSGGATSRTERQKRRLSRQNVGDNENIVFANTSALVSATYAKNPSVEVTPVDREDMELKTLADTAEELTNTLFAMRASPGVNIKRKGKRSVVMSTLTNESYMRVDYVFKQESSEQALEDLRRLSEELENAKSVEEIRRIEGDIMALEHAIDFLEPSGPKVRFISPYRFLRDIDAEEQDLSDSQWIMYSDYLSTEYIKGRFGKRSPVGQEFGGDGSAKSIYAPSHVLNLNQSSQEGMNEAESEITTYTLLSDPDSSKGRTYGYDDEESFARAQRTKVWYVWDKTTRRIYLFSDRDWSWPLWVWDDLYHLEGFFNVVPLIFVTDPEEGVGRSETTYYLDQQDSVNEVNFVMAQARQWAKNNLVWDTNTGAERADIEKILKGTGDVAIGLKVPDGMKLEDVLPRSVIPPALQYAELFDKTPLLQAIDRLSSVSAVMRGTEFKTNTTNRAIDSYESSQQTRLDERIDAIEDQTGEIGWMVIQMCLQFMSQEEVAAIIGQQNAAGWVAPLSVEQIRGQFNVETVGGSTQKPTSANKQKMALEIGQILGQFVQAAPIPVVMTMLKVFQQAFDEVVLDESDWNKIEASIAGPAAAPTPAGGEAADGLPGAAAGGEETAPDQAIAQLAVALDQLPPEIREALGASIARGVPAREALARIVEASSAPTDVQPQ